MRPVTAPCPPTLPQGAMQPIGYVVLQHAVRLDRPVNPYDRWLRRIPTEFHWSVLGETEPAVTSATDQFQLASLRNYPQSHATRPGRPQAHIRPAGRRRGLSARMAGLCRRATGSSRISPLESWGAAKIPLPVAS